MKTVYAVVQVWRNPGEAAGFGKVRLAAGRTDGVNVVYTDEPPIASMCWSPLVPPAGQDSWPGWFDTPAEAVVAYAKDRMRFVAEHNAHVAEQLGSLSRQMTEMGVVP